ncbi:hypothetical protein FHG87_018224 [Trinorchestia longiramus]|nr:hypothetical protein FHG87_018224 [Trinorchestia longiramus]
MIRSKKEADVDKGLRDSPAIQKAELASFENDVAPIMWKSMLLDPQYMTPSVCKELRKQYNSQLKKGLTGYEAVCPVLQKFRAIYPLCKTEGEEQVKRKPGSNDGDDINWAPGGADELEEELEDEEEEGYEEEEEDEEGYEDEEEEGDGEEEGDEGEEEEDEEGDEECELTEEELAQIRKQAREEVFREYLLKGYDLRGIEFADGGDRYFVDTLKEKKSDQASFPPDVLNISPEVLEVDDSDTDQNEVEVVKEVVEDVKSKKARQNTVTTTTTTVTTTTTMPQHKVKKSKCPDIALKKQTVSKMRKLASRKARKDGMVMKKRLVTAAEEVQQNLNKNITRSIEGEMVARAGVSALSNMKIVKPAAGTASQKKKNKKNKKK